MQRLTRFVPEQGARTSGRLFVVVISLGAAAFFACRGSTSTPSSPSGPIAGVVSLAITGPSILAPAETVRFTAVATLSDGSMQNYSDRVTWHAWPGTVLTISNKGEATAHAPGDASVDVAFQEALPRATATVTVLPPNTFRLTGKVLESGLPVHGAAVTVLSGTGAGLSTTTDYFGGFRLYGVAGLVQIKVSKIGYEDMVKTVTVAQSDVLDFPEARQTAAIPQLSGVYTLTLTADRGCPNELVFAIQPLPADLRKPRDYVAVVTQDGASLLVTVNGPGFNPPTDHFSGRIRPDTIEFDLGDGYFGYGPDGLSERLLPTSYLTYEGIATATRGGTVLTGRLNGAIDVYELTGNFYRLVAGCQLANHEFALTPRGMTAR